MGGIWKPAMLMVMVQTTFGICNILYKVAIYDGMSTIVIAAYRLAFAAIITIPLALIFERNKRPKMTRRVLFMTFLSGFFAGTLFQNLFYGALALAPATLVSALYNLIPTITFILAVSLGNRTWERYIVILINEVLLYLYSTALFGICFERLNWGAAAGKAKVIGTVLGLAGALLLTFYKGIEFEIWPFRINILEPSSETVKAFLSFTSLSQDYVSVADTGRELLGVLCVVVASFCFALWLIIQAKISEEYPCHFSSIALMSTMGAIQSFIFGFCVIRDLSEWRLGWDIRLLTVTFSGILAQGIMIVIMAWIVRTKGPLFASAFHPLVLLIVALTASLILDESIYLGSVLGGVLIVCGLYTVLWGKSNEMQKMSQSVPAETMENSQATRPLLDPC